MHNLKHRKFLLVSAVAGIVFVLGFTMLSASEELAEPTPNTAAAVQLQKNSMSEKIDRAKQILTAPGGARSSAGGGTYGEPILHQEAKILSSSIRASTDRLKEFIEKEFNGNTTQATRSLRIKTVFKGEYPKEPEKSIFYWYMNHERSQLGLTEKSELIFTLGNAFLRYGKREFEIIDGNPVTKFGEFSLRFGLSLVITNLPEKLCLDLRYLKHRGDNKFNDSIQPNLTPLTGQVEKNHMAVLPINTPCLKDSQGNYFGAWLLLLLDDVPVETFLTQGDK